MGRVTPDGYDIIVWRLDETSGAYRNTGTQSPNSSTTDLTVQNSVDRNGNGLFGDPCANFPGVGNFPTGSSATRNSAFGANTINPAYPITVSAWVNVRSYSTTFTSTLVGKQYRDTGITNTWSTPFHALGISLTTANSGLSWFVSCATSSSTRLIYQIDDFPIPLQQWCHVGLTYDGYTLKAFLNGCQCITVTSGTINAGLASGGSGVPISYTDGTNGFGPWVIGALTATGSSNKEEAPYQIQDVRIASIARPLSYFQQIYKFGQLPISLVDATQYYKLRVFDTSCTEPTPIIWIDTEVSLVNLPVTPCSGVFSPLEVLDTWFA
jgi:hypothetical protein